MRQPSEFRPVLFSPADGDMRVMTKDICPCEDETVKARPTGEPRCPRFTGNIRRKGSCGIEASRRDRKSVV